MKMFLHLVMVGVLFNCELLVVSAWKIPIPGPDQETTGVISGIAAKILSQCYSDCTEVVIHGDSDPIVVKSLQEGETLAVILFNNSTLIDDPPKLRLHRNSFVITPRSIEQLVKMLSTFKNSQRWNIMAPFIILDRSGEKCRNAEKMLKVVWQINLIEVLFFCVNSESVPMIYTFNPYTNRAPQPWKQVFNTAKESARWTMFSRPLRDESICESVSFDRSRHLDGSIIKIAASVQDPENVVLNKYYDESVMPQLFADVKYVMDKLKYTLNVSLLFAINSDARLFAFMENETCDVLALKAVLGEGFTYPVNQAQMYIVTNNRGFYTPLENIMNYYGTVTLVSMCIILPITFVVLLLSTKGRRWSFAAFEILRLLINTSLHTRFDTIALRIFFSTIFLYFLIIHATFQGRIVSFLMKQEYRKNAETLTDLRDVRYEEIHIKWTLISFITDPILRKKLVPIDQDCISGVIKNYSIAGICNDIEFIDLAYEHKLHVSQEPVFIVPNYYRTRSDWPLQERFNTFLMWLASSEQTPDDFTRRFFSKKKETQNRVTKMAAPEEIRPISITMLSWIFIFLLIGLKLAAMSLTCERRIRPEAARLRDNRRAELLNIERRRRRLINQIISGQYLPSNSRPRSI